MEKEGCVNIPSDFDSGSFTVEDEYTYSVIMDYIEKPIQHTLLDETSQTDISKALLCLIISQREFS